MCILWASHDKPARGVKNENDCRLGRLLMQLYAHGNISSIVPFFLFLIIQQITSFRFYCWNFVHDWVNLALALKVTEITVSLAFLFLPRMQGRRNPALQVASSF